MECAMRENDDITHAVRSHSNTVARVCSMNFGRRPECDDAFQETFLRYAQSSVEFADDEHRKAWLIRVCSNVCKDMLKRAETKTVPIGDFDETTNPFRQIDSRIESSERSYELSEALHNLEERYRLPLYLKYYEGYTAAQIGNMLGLPENTVYTNLSRGRKKLKEVLSRLTGNPTISISG